MGNGLQDKTSENLQEKHRDDSRVELRITKDRLKAYITVIPSKGGKHIHIEKLYDTIKKNNIKFGIKQENLEKIVNEKIYNKEILIAEGIEPQNGKDGKIEYYFNNEKIIRPKIDEKGRVDFFNLNLVENVTTDQLLAVKIPPTQGVSGRNIFDEEIKAKPGKDPIIPLGKNVYLSEDKTKCFASIDGQVQITNGKISVYPVFEIKGNVDPSTGNIDFVGNVIVRGNVLTGFKVTAKGDVEIYGVVEGAYISSGGNILLRRGVQGHDKAIIKASGNVLAKYLEHCNVEADGDIIVSDAIMHSNVSCGKRLQVSGRKGLIVGGLIRAADEVSAKNVGSPMATFTQIEVGVNPVLKEKFLKIKSELEQQKSNLEKTEKAIDLLTKLKEKKLLTKEKENLLEKLEKTKKHLSEQIYLNEKSYEELYQEINNLDRGKIKVTETVYPGVKVTIGNISMKIKETIKNVVLYKADEQIKLASFNKR
ncbi:MAG: uncharacterized protein PWP21_1242 [Thermosediminibacterales bacterium]|nr:uncharacterized protein [Thermosediminibacterales bacterium]